MSVRVTAMLADGEVYVRGERVMDEDDERLMLTLIKKHMPHRGRGRA